MNQFEKNEPIWKKWTSFKKLIKLVQNKIWPGSKFKP